MKQYLEWPKAIFDNPVDHTGNLSGMKRQLQSQLVDLYKAVLAYQMKSVYLYYQNRGLVALRDMVALDNWDGQLTAVKDAEKLFQQDLLMYTARGTAAHLGSLVSDVNSEKNRQCSRDLRVTDPRDDKKRIEQKKGGSVPACLWILKNSSFLEWEKKQDSCLLWVKGGSGKGKTMQLCGVIDRIDGGISDDRTRRTYNLAYFFCQGDDFRINTGISVLRGLIYLLVNEQPSLLSYVRKKWDDAGKSLFEDANAWVALSDIFQEMLRDPDLKSTYLIIDALDECTADLPKLLELLGLVLASSTHLNIILSSQSSPDRERMLWSDGKHTQLCLEDEENAKEVSTAVKLYIDDRVSRLTSHNTDISEKDKNELPGILHRKAEGTFLWVSLVIRDLKEAGSGEVLRVAEENPIDLRDLYHTMATKIKDLPNSQRFLSVLAVAASVYRPLYLYELGAFSDFPHCILRPTDVKKIAERCSPFLVVQDNQVFIVHQSAKDYLCGPTSVIHRSGSVAATHRSIFRRSIKLLSSTLQHDMYRLQSPGFPVDRVQTPCEDPLASARYSCVYWIDHLHGSMSADNPDREKDFEALHSFLEEKYFHWLEALSLLHAIPAGVAAMDALEDLQVSNRPALTPGGS